MTLFAGHVMKGMWRKRRLLMQRTRQEILSPEWIRDISIDDLPEIYQDVAHVIGLENAIRLSEHLGGQLVYFPKLDGIVKKKRDEAIRQEFNGSNVRGLARKYGISGKQLMRILTGKGRL